MPHYCALCNKCLFHEKVFFHLDSSYCLNCCPWKRIYSKTLLSEISFNLYDHIVKVLSRISERILTS